MARPNYDRRSYGVKAPALTVSTGKSQLAAECNHHVLPSRLSGEDWQLEAQRLSGLRRELNDFVEPCTGDIAVGYSATKTRGQRWRLHSVERAAEENGHLICAVRGLEMSIVLLHRREPVI